MAGLTAVNYLGVRRTAWTTRVILALVLTSLPTVVVATFLGGRADLDRVGSLTSGGTHGVLQAAALLFFAFAGYARISTLGETCFSSFLVLTYYGITNAAALTLPAPARRWPRTLAAAGLLGCLVLALNLPTSAVVGGGVLLLFGACARLVMRRRTGPTTAEA